MEVKMTDIAALAREWFKYEDGKLFWAKDKTNGIKAGNEAGCIHAASGYRVVRLAGKLYKTHRLIWYIFNGCPGTLVIDHIDGDKLNNKIENLRAVTQKVNSRNRKDKSEPYTGVTYVTSRQRYVAQITVNYKNLYLGSFKTLAEAQEARKNAETIHHGE
jgi:hypothetical protein